MSDSDFNSALDEDSLKVFADNSWRGTIDGFAKKVSGERWHRYKHVQYIVDQIQPAIEKGNARLIVSLPPQYGKSQLISKWTPSWYLEWNPEHFVILASYNASRAAWWGGQVRNTLSASPLCTTVLQQDTKRKDLWMTTEGGGMITGGIGSGLTGWPANLAIIDDPHKDAMEAFSRAKLDQLKQWHEAVLNSRIQDGGSIVVLMTRWHEDDYVGQLLANEHEEWTYIRLPEVAEEDDPLGRAPGEVLCPARFSAEAVEKRRQGAGVFWESMHQQRPTPMEGGIVEREWILDPDRWGEPPPLDDLYIVQAYDLAYSLKKTADYTSCTTIGIRKDGKPPYWILGCWRQRLATADQEAKIAMSARHWGAHVVGIEAVGAQQVTVDHIAEELQEISVVPLSPEGMNKGLRLKFVTPILQHGKVRFSNELARDHDARKDIPLIQELLAFPNGKHDDMVDSLVYALELARDEAVEGGPTIDAGDLSVEDWSEVEDELDELDAEIREDNRSQGDVRVEEHQRHMDTMAEEARLRTLTKAELRAEKKSRDADRKDRARGRRR